MSKGTEYKTIDVEFNDDDMALINRLLETGSYKSIDEIVSTGLSLLMEQDRADKIAHLQKMITEGIESGIAEEFDLEEFQRDMRKKLIEAEKSGFSSRPPDEIRDAVKQRLKSNPE